MAQKPARWILLVEDNPGDVLLMEEAFETVCPEHRVLIAKDGAEAVDMVWRRGRFHDAPRPDLILLDLNLPKKSGTEVLRELKGDARYARIPVIVFSSSSSDIDVQDCYSTHVNAYVPKADNPAELVQNLRSLAGFWLTTARLPE